MSKRLVSRHASVNVGTVGRGMSHRDKRVAAKLSTELVTL
jgi:hypothetical protein